MNKYISFRENDKNGVTGYYILQKAHPNYVARISIYPMEGVLSYAPISGYNLWVNFDGTLMGNFINIYQGAIDEINLLMIEMANWFLVNRIKENPKRYAKFLIK